MAMKAWRAHVGYARGRSATCAVESITELVNIYENCREEYLIAGFTRKFDIHKLREGVAHHM